MWQNPPHTSTIDQEQSQCQPSVQPSTLQTDMPVCSSVKEQHNTAPEKGNFLAHHEAMTECLRPERAGSLSNIFSSRRRLEPEVEMEN